MVERGLAAGEIVVVEGFHKLTPGMKVRVSQQEMETKDKMCIRDSVNGAHIGEGRVGAMLLGLIIFRYPYSLF